ncbi:MAG: hypothetical protein AAGL34_01630 [Bacteroidota bacterium]
MKTQTKILIVFLILYALDPMTYGFVFGYLISILLIAHLLVLKGLFDRLALSLLLFSGIYALFYATDPSLGSQFVLIYAFIPTTLYISGKILQKELNNDLSAFWLLFFVGFVFSLPGIISILMDISANGFVKIKRDVTNIWTGELQSATNVASGFALNMCIPGLLLLGWKTIQKKSHQFFLIGIYVISLICVLRLGSRTQIALSVFTLIVAVFYKLRKQNARQNVGLIFLIFLSVNVVVSYATLDTDTELLSAYADRANSKTNSASTAGGRTQKWEKSIAQMFKEPLGWDLREFGFSHNLWLDTARVGGILALFLLLLFTFGASKKIYKLYKLHNRPKLLNGQLILYCTCFFLSFFVEPILEGYFILFSLFCLTMGFVSTYLENEIQAEHNIENAIVNEGA